MFCWLLLASCDLEGPTKEAVSGAESPALESLLPCADTISGKTMLADVCGFLMCVARRVVEVGGRVTCNGIKLIANHDKTLKMN